MTQGQEANDDNVGICFDLPDNNVMLSVLVRIASIWRFQWVHIQLDDKIRKFH